MSADYWKARCEAAEAALRRARSAIPLHPVRRAVIAELGELRPGEDIATGLLAGRLRWTRNRVIYVLSAMERVGLVDRADPPCRGRGHEVHWRLGHMVQVDAE